MDARAGISRLAVVAGLGTAVVLGPGAGVSAAGEGHWQPSATAIHVAPWGHDNWSGTLRRPFRTLAQAQRRARTLTRRMRADVVVNLRGGTYALDAPLRLSDAAGDSGRNGHRVVYQAYGHGTPAQERPVVSGGRRVSGWRLADRARNVWQAEVGDLVTRQLFVDGRRATRARLDGGIPGTVTATKDGYVTDSVAPQSWRNPRDIELLYRDAYPWTEPRCGVAAISGDANSTTITMDQPCYRWAAGSYAGLIDPSHVENSPSFLTAPGSFYLDRSRPRRHVLSYVPRPGEDLRRAEVVAPVLETLVQGEGVHDVALRGLTFSYATWLAPDRPTGFVHHFGQMYEHGEPPVDEDPFNVSDQARTMPGHVAFHGSRRVTIEDGRFTRLGGQALELSLDSSQNLVRGNVFEDVSGGGVEIGNRHPGGRGKDNRDNRVENNRVHDVGVEYSGSVGIYLEATQSSTIAHNQVDGVPYSGITLGEYWTSYPEGESLAFGNRVLANKVFDTLRVLIDGGGIWSVGPQGTTYENGGLVSGNLSHDNVSARPFPWNPSQHGGFGLYTDDGNRYITWRDNVTYRNGGAPAGGCLPLGPEVMRDNFWQGELVFGGPPFCGEENEVELIDNTTLQGDPEAACAALPACAAIVAGAGLEPAYRSLLSP